MSKGTSGLYDCAAIVGVGMIGASIGLALKERKLCRDVLGVGRRAASLKEAQKRGAIDRFIVEPGPELAAAQVVVVCAPVDQVADLTLRCSAFVQPEALLTDAGSTKKFIVEAVESGLADDRRFIGSHPIAGSEKTGASAGSAWIFHGRCCVLTPTSRTPQAVVEQAVEFWSAIGMHILEMTPAEHDRALARTSHLPHLASAALATLYGAKDRPLTGTGLRDVLRIAGGDPALWTAIFRHNRKEVLSGLDALIGRLEEAKASLDKEDYRALERLLADGKRSRDDLGS